LGKLRSRTLFELLLTATLVGAAYYLSIYVPKHLKAGEPVLALANYFLTYAPIQSVNQRAYVVPDSLEVWDTPAEIRTEVATLKSGEEVRVVGRFRDWAHVRALDDREGWVSDDQLANFETHEAEQHLVNALSEMPAQAVGEPVGVENVHIEPSRAAAVVNQVNPERVLEIFGRRLVQRSDENNTPDIMTVASSHPEAWYLVREGSHAGWILGRRVRLAIPKSISAYAQDANLVAWLVLDTVNDNGHMVPQYVVAERAGPRTCDFTKIQVLTWWKRKQTYAVAFREGGIEGYFPILVTHEGSAPYFRLRLEGANGSKYQMIYGLFDTLTRLIGTADTWASDAIPEPPSPRFPKRQTRTPWLTGW
jgi:uncharacterized protein YgiM (DUF1202 family)